MPPCLITGHDPVHVYLAIQTVRVKATEGCSSGRSMPAHTTPGSLDVPGPNYSSPCDAQTLD
jgi:hypothetical protein